MLPTTLDIEVKKGREDNVIRLVGKLDTTVFAHFTEVCTPYADKNNIIFDLSRLSYISSSGIGGFFKLMKIAEQNGYKIILCSLQPSIHEVIRLTKLQNVFVIAPDENEARKMLKAG